MDTQHNDSSDFQHESIAQKLRSRTDRLKRVVFLKLYHMSEILQEYETRVNLLLFCYIIHDVINSTPQTFLPASQTTHDVSRCQVTRNVR